MRIICVLFLSLTLSVPVSSMRCMNGADEAPVLAQQPEDLVAVSAAEPIAAETPAHAQEARPEFRTPYCWRPAKNFSRLTSTYPFYVVLFVLSAAWWGWLGYVLESRIR